MGEEGAGQDGGRKGAHHSYLARPSSWNFWT
jgi:hypothetical protein